MQGLLIFVLLCVCVFAPMIVFAVIGYKAIVEMGKRPMQGGRVMIPMIIKLLVTSAVLLGILMFLLEVFG